MKAPTMQDFDPLSLRTGEQGVTRDLWISKSAPLASSVTRLQRLDETRFLATPRLAHCLVLFWRQRANREDANGRTVRTSDHDVHHGYSGMTEVGKKVCKLTLIRNASAPAL